MSERTLLHAALAIGLLAAGALGARWIVETAPKASTSLELPGPKPVPVQTVTLTAMDVPRTLEAVGTLQAAQEAVLASEIGGRVVLLGRDRLTEGTFFEEGALILGVDTSSLQAEIAAQESSIELSKSREAASSSDLAAGEATLELLKERRDILIDGEARWRALANKGMAEDARVDQARDLRLAADIAVQDAERGLLAVRSGAEAAGLQVQIAQDRRAVLRTQIERAEIRAPFAGWLTLGAGGGTAPSVGTVLSPLVPFGSLLDASALRLVTEVHEDDLAALSRGTRALAAPLSRPGSLLEGQVSALGGRVDTVTRTVRVEATFPVARSRDASDESSEDAPIPSGTFARVELEGEAFRRAVWVELGWLTYREGRAVAFVVTGEGVEGGPFAEQRVVKFHSGTYEGGRVVTEGLWDGDVLITSGLEFLGDGAPVAVAPAAAPTESPAGSPTGSPIGGSSATEPEGPGR